MRVIDEYHEVIYSSFFFTENKRKVEMIELLKSRGYASDPVKAWKESISEQEDNEEGSENGEESASTTGADYNYLLSMQLWSLTKEKKEELLKNRDKKVHVAGELQMC